MKYSAIDVKRLLAVSSFLVLLFANNSLTSADDTEIYQATYQAGSTGRPKVLVIFDDSGSMRTVVQTGGERPAYDPNGTYVSAFDSSKIYWSNNDSPPSSNTNQYFTKSSNRCEESYQPLDEVGKFTSKARRWRPANGIWRTETNWVCVRWRRWRCRRWEEVTETYWDGQDAEWRALTSNDQTPTHVDCAVDVTSPGNPGNGPSLGDGYPFQPSAPDAADSEAYTANRNDSNLSWGSGAYTFYSAHYMDWLNDDTIVTVEKDRMQVAQEVVNSLIDSNTGIDFGLAVFNDNSDGVYLGNGNYDNDNDHGGRIVQRVIEGMTLAQREALTGDSGIINSLEHDGWTPLCESTYEVYRYLAGETVLWGDNRDTSVDSPARDTLAESSGTYIAPTSDCAYTYVILMTDGFPTYDTDANSRIETLTGKTCANYLSDQTSNGNRLYKKNCLPILTEFMANQDLDGDANNGNQFGITYTIGFGTEQDLLEDAATKGKGLYYQAENSEELAAAFQGAIINILSTDSTFTSPGVAVDTFTRTRSRNEVFFAMFKPGASADWQGNIKRLDIDYIDDVAVLVDKNGVPAMDEATGLIKDNANTLWSSGADGPLVGRGGVGELLALSNLTTRANRIWTNTGASDALELFNATNVTADAYGFDIIGQIEDDLVEGLPDDFDENTLPSELLFAYWGVPNQAELEDVISWGIGYDREDEDQDDSITDNRPWILGDILHSKPFIMNYGARGSYTNANPDVRILAGTNAGFLHMFSNDDGQEDWAFFPKELARVMTQRKENGASLEHVYGVDAGVVVHTEDLNYDGTLDYSDGDKAWLYFGLRRGGRYMYALDASNPDSPSLLWKLTAWDTGFSELGQTWSEPVIGRIPGYYDDTGKAKPVLIFGAGYDPGKDDTESLAVNNTDEFGRGVFIIDAQTGALVWSVTPADDSATNMQETGLLHSVPAGVTVLDSNGDDLLDRIYFADTGGNLWRVDMPGNALPTSSQSAWHIVKVLAANGGTKASDRRFFNPPDVVRTDYLGVPVDAILLGSGDRTNPAELDEVNDPAVNNQFYMVRDQQIGPYFTALDDDRCDSEPAHDFRCSLPIAPSALYDVTDNDLQDGDEDEQAAAQAALNNASGWRLDLAANGEKNLARSLTIDGKVYFTSFSPDPQVLNICEPLPGTGRLYNVDLLSGERVRDFDDDGADERYISVGGLIPDTPSPHFDAEGEIRLLLPPGGTAPKIVGNPMETDSEIQQPYGSYWHRDDG